MCCVVTRRQTPKLRPLRTVRVWTMYIDVDCMGFKRERTGLSGKHLLRCLVVVLAVARISCDHWRFRTFDSRTEVKPLLGYEVFPLMLDAGLERDFFGFQDAVWPFQCGTKVGERGGRSAPVVSCIGARLAVK